MRRFFAALAVAAFACGGESADQHAEAAHAETASETTAAASVAEGNGAVHEVQMLVTAEGNYVFDPVELTIKAGDTVRWINVSGGPHNVQFFPDQIPSGAESVLTAAMSGRTIGPLSGSLVTAPNAVYEVVFAGAPAGQYDYTCTPHQLLGMNATLTVE